MRLWNRILLSAVVLAAPTAVILHHLNQSQELPAAPLAKADEQSQLQRLKQLENELAALKAHSASATGIDRDRMEAQLNALKQQMNQSGKTGETAGNPANSNVSSGDSSNIAEKIAAEEEQTRQLAQSLDGALASEAADPRWSSAAAQQISRSLTSGAQEHTRLGEVRCGSTLCRIEATHDGPEAEQGFILQLGQLEPFRQSEGFAQRVERGDGSVATTLFVSRSGHRLPNVSGGADPQS
jgi:hypothetical protein